LTLVFSLMGVLNFAHASFYMLGAYLAFALDARLGFLAALLLAPLVVGAIGMAVERFALRRAHNFGHVAELLLTFGLALLIEEIVQLIWGKASVPFRFPPLLEQPLFATSMAQFPAYKALMALIALLIVGALYLLVKRTRVGLILRAALTKPQMVEALGHNVPRVFMLVFGLGAALAGVAGVIGGAAFVTEPNMATAVGAIVFVVCVVGGMGSLIGAFWASLLIAMVQTFAVSVDASISRILTPFGINLGGWPLAELSVAQAAPILPFLMMVIVLVLRPSGLFGARL
jgi:branched-chain amino acid transport system permease protein